MTLYANTFSISTMFSMIFSRTRKSEHLRSFAEKEKTANCKCKLDTRTVKIS